MAVPFLEDITLIFVFSVAVLFVCHRLKIPSVVGFILTGFACGPHGLRLIEASHEVELLSEIGIVLLLFTIGLEFSLERLLHLRKIILIGGSTQVLLTAALGAGAAIGIAGLDLNHALLIGFLVSLSSTAIVLKLLQERAEVESPHGRTSLGILLFQDMISVPMMLAIPWLAGKAPEQEIKGLPIIKALLLVLFILLLRRLIPKLLSRIVRLRSQELFLLGIVTICLAVAWASALAGLSLALGAFLAGLAISESDYSHQALGDILPFRDVFLSFFFVSVGMLLNLSYFIQHLHIIFPLVVAVLILKGGLTALSVFAAGYPIRTMVICGLGLAQIGEFSFILAQSGLKNGLLDPDVHQLFLSVTLATMMLTPMLISFGPKIADAVLELPLPRVVKRGSVIDSKSENGIHPALNQHLVLVGFGLTGRQIVRVASSLGKPFVIIEVNPETVRTERQKGLPIFYGDASHKSVLDHAHIQNASTMIVAIPDPIATRRIISAARRMNPQLYLIARSRFSQEVPSLLELGADEVIAEEFETSIEILTRLLWKCMVPRNEVERFLEEARADGYMRLRALSEGRDSLMSFRPMLQGAGIEIFRLDEHSVYANHSIAEARFRQRFGLTLLAIQREQSILSNPEAQTVLLPGDHLVVFGERTALNNFDINPKRTQT